jgi:hypothetical protein
MESQPIYSLCRIKQLINDCSFGQFQRLYGVVKEEQQLYNESELKEIITLLRNKGNYFRK